MTGQKGHTARRVSLALVPVAAVCFAAAIWGLFGNWNGSAVTTFFVTGGVALVTGVIFGHVAILRLTGEAGERILFETFFPMFMGLVPVAGPVIALLSAIKLLRGKLGPATISTTSGGYSSVSHYDATDLGRAGLPVGLLLLIVVGLQPAVAVFLFGDSTTPGTPERQPTPAVEPVAEPEESSAERLRRYGRHACDGVFECYSREDHVGQAAGRITMQVDDGGRVTGVDVKLPGTPASIQECIRTTCGRIRIPDFEGPGGRLICEYAGSIAGTTRSLSIHAKFAPRAEQ